MWIKEAAHRPKRDVHNMCPASSSRAKMTWKTRTLTSLSGLTLLAAAKWSLKSLLTVLKNWMVHGSSTRVPHSSGNKSRGVCVRTMGAYITLGLQSYREFLTLGLSQTVLTLSVTICHIHAIYKTFSKMLENHSFGIFFGNSWTVFRVLTDL